MRVNILVLTPEIARKYKDEARRCLVGDRTCSLQNMRKSCFAIELCDGKRSTGSVGDLDLSALLSYRHAFVAVGFDTNCFMGCISIDDAASSHVLTRGAAGPCELEEGDGFIGNLCVSDEHRAQHVGTRLVNHACLMYSRAWLSVRTEHGGDDEGGRMLGDRKRGLVGYYESLGFRERSHSRCGKFVLMRR